ncbi:hypothetical protein L218DRAFT_999316 [Marasmius fiardii PR-910]|nr:hypothetical protein L218DRAFT_999316 [Marasmius fiardii PR-910]
MASNEDLKGVSSKKSVNPTERHEEREGPSHTARFKPLVKNGRQTKSQTHLKSSNDDAEDSKASKTTDTSSPAVKPTLQQSWDAIMKTVETLDEDIAKGYKEDIDTLLVFAGLFSAVVTAFTIESYKWLQQDPEDATVALLSQIAEQLSGRSPSPDSTLPPEFVASASVVRINTFWFLSLILALVDALFGLLCKQWLREHQRQTYTRTPGQALALRWLRNQSFEQWHVSKILASLPILLEIALFLFFAGLLELLWGRHPVPFSIALVVVSLAVVFYLTTTILPGINIVQQVLQIYHYFAFDNPIFHPDVIVYLPPIHFVCPYKSPQSWLVLRLFSGIYHLPGCKRLLYSLITKFSKPWKNHWNSIEDLDSIITKNVSDLHNWPSHDLNVIQRFSSIPRCPDLYELNGFQWLVRETRDMPSMTPHLKNVLRQLPPHLVMLSVFDKWVLPSGESAWDAKHIDAALESQNRDDGDHGVFGDSLSTRDLGLASQILCFRHLLASYWDFWAKFDRKGDELARGAGDLYRTLKQPGNSRFIRFFFHPEELLLGTPKDWRGKVLDLYGQKWDGLDEDSQARLAWRLAESVLAFLASSEPENIENTLLASSYGCDFFTSVNDKLLRNKTFLESDGHHQSWMNVLNRMRHLHQLPPNHFDPVPGYFPIASDELKKVLTSPSISESDLVDLLDAYKRCWDKAHNSKKEKVVQMLSSYINQLPLAPSYSHLTAWTEELWHNPPCSPTIFVFMTSQPGLEFLKFVNRQLAADQELHFWWKRTMVGPWVDALERVRVFCELPSGYFDRIPRRDWESREIVGWYTTTRKSVETLRVDAGPTETIQSEVQVTSVRMILEQRRKNEVGSSASATGRSIDDEDVAMKISASCEGEGNQTIPRAIKERETDTDVRVTEGHAARNRHRLGGPGAEHNV